MKSGFPPTLRNARTGELTPRGSPRPLAETVLPIFDVSCPELNRLARHQAAESEAHADLVQAAVEVCSSLRFRPR